MSTPTIDTLAAGKYLSLTTFKKDGTAVATPVWVTREGDRLYVITEGDSGKAKRLRNSGRVLLASCDMRGRFDGEQVEGTATVLDDPADVAAVLARVKDRFGLMASLTGLTRTLRRAKGSQAGLEITVGTAAAS